MKPSKELEKILDKIDGKGYKAYKELRGQYNFMNFTLSIDYVQGDPFAAPSRIRVTVPEKKAGFKSTLYDTKYKKRAVVDYLSRTMAKNIHKNYKGVEGSGKSGLLSIGYCGQEILERNYVIIDENIVEARLTVGLPAAGRRVLGRKAKSIFFEAIPKIVESSLFYNAIDSDGLINQVKLVEDQNYIRKEIEKRDLIAFIANGSVLPRESGVSERPMKKDVVPFISPEEYEIEIELPNKGKIKGMGIKEGVTLIVGGGFHGKSTLLRALELGIYDHISEDGREYVVTREDAVKIKAEDGRRVEKVNISPFINNLPMKEDTRRFSTENASGSTSQAANIMEALEIGTDLLLIDEDTSATNFMIRDGRMQNLVIREKEPITPFIDNVRTLYSELGVSSVLVIGGSGDYFEVADHVIMMDEYKPKDVTEKAKNIVKKIKNSRKIESKISLKDDSPRIVSKSSFLKGKKGVKIKPRGLDKITYNKLDIELRDLEQLIDSNQVNTMAFVLEYIMNKIVDNKMTLSEIVERVYDDMYIKGLDVVSFHRGNPGDMVLPRKYEIAAMLNRFRNLKIK
ncbi:ABC-ATPase domain-containing protein [Clostridium sp. D2Q-14]|uniref:ABC-ATPase domain-containing protein n=1 Tax=Anaeromonas gelatinilytica TaxID=2683194 RepID=UPI00193BB6F4|nr:ABC-ATPase domain-containing protein [Anaeromonas gelatinilytica]MBS4535045.1 ABC-ATPase domain-containing protein [Anaeromonas gelatinilytica]